jgi:hypothetical protein
MKASALVPAEDSAVETICAVAGLTNCVDLEDLWTHLRNHRFASKVALAMTLVQAIRALDAFCLTVNRPTPFWGARRGDDKLIERLNVEAWARDIAPKSLPSDPAKPPA